ncbi:hypothetical protein ASPZODRAFT_28382 [Penicilliopsis zonata CBS 506.65]|uniref:RRM domain-containing protein n=1 Tax=Penicilliopsis zonata CBS 506.65 TaxID=1073090 RepID=A0A1L9S886_9EURO|nr:hypothetical protein ASPZODRAFT_28382 [Penicilliopsis zonata CBS 506.65]OJJ43376.1 hypothetical protein ASPZODRAFT_28382 [Penicilliopsis zonata CBS 506.65]
MASATESAQKKRKLQDGPEIEIDVSAPEPPSKKALRKAKKKGAETPADASSEEKTEVAATEAKPAKETRSDYGIWIGNLPFTTNKDDIRKFFTSNCSFSDATITRIHLPKGAARNNVTQNRGFAYVDFATSKALKEAMGLSEQLILGRRVLIKDAKNFEGRPEKSQEEGKSAAASNSGNPPSKRIFVGNLGFDATKELIEEHFATCGTVSNVHVATFQDTGKCKGYAWVEFEDLAAAEAAVRGFMMVNEDDEDEDEADDASSDEKEKSRKPKKPRQRRVWVNQLLGRRMRMEFAEDATTRYKKRFGKEGEGRKNDTADITEVENGEHQDSQPVRQRKPKPAVEDNSRYSKETVQRLSGAIIAAKGQKTTFD